MTSAEWSNYGVIVVVAGLAGFFSALIYDLISIPAADNVKSVNLNARQGRR